MLIPAAMRFALFLPAVLLVFTVSGFAGLIYESIWSHYLKLFLGHAAYAQTLVLAIFMGGMALGAWAASRFSTRWRDPLLAYALIEALIGLIALGFHAAFVAATGAAFDYVAPALGAPLAVQAFNWMLGALLLAPQAVLLGMTFPLMAAGVLRLRPERSGYVVAMLYFTNSLGGAVGVLASGFYLIDAAGLPGALAVAGGLNLAVAAVVVLLPRRAAGAPSPPVAAAVPPERAAPSMQRVLLAVAALTGMSSFMYEMGWIRMLSLVLGTTTHAFELMLSAFILGIAFGGLWVRRRIDATRDPVRMLGFVQLAMGAAALATLPVYVASFEFMQSAMHSLARNAGGYLAFNVLSHGISLAVMFPAAFCAGMTLPLVTAALLRLGAGERAIGRVYAANTAGAIVGVLAAVHLGFALLGLKGLIVAGAAVDLVLGVLLLGAGARARRLPAFAAALSVAAIALALFAVRLDPLHLASGVYRWSGLLRPGGGEEVRLHLDGKTATVSVTRGRELLALRTNGKSEGAIRVDGGGPSNDEITMTLTGALPLLLAPQARRIANIGFGTGITTHVMLASEAVETVDTIEIEPAVVAAAVHFRAVNARALDDPRSRIHFDDAKSHFAARQMRYDVIVSEPSNPWVSGVASLFSTEFYRDVRRHLRDGGLLVQWINAYETTPELIATVMRALDANFPDYELWMSNAGDMIVVAAHNGKVPAPDPRALASGRLGAELERFSIRNLDDLLLHRIAGRAALRPYFASFRVPANSDFYPVLERKAPAARFLGRQTDQLQQLLEAGMPLLEWFDRPRQPDPAKLSPGDRPWLQRAALAGQARAAATYLRSGSLAELAALSSAAAGDLVLLRSALVECGLRVPAATMRRVLMDTAWLVNSRLPAAERAALWAQLAGSPCAGRMEESERTWLRLHRAVALGASADIAEAALRILAAGAAVPPDMLAYALAARMAGLIRLGQGDGARRAFFEHGSGIGSDTPWQPAFRFLLARSGLQVTRN